MPLSLVVGVLCVHQRKQEEDGMKQRKKKNTNVLELLAIEYAMKSFQKVASGKHVKILTDNTCTRSYIKYKRRVVLT